MRSYVQRDRQTNLCTYFRFHFGDRGEQRGERGVLQPGAFQVELLIQEMEEIWDGEGAGCVQGHDCAGQDGERVR